MIKTGSIFREWLPGWAIKAGLIFCILPAMLLLGLYNSNSTYTASYLGIEPEDMQFTMSLTYGTLIATMLIEQRFARFFAARNYLIGINLLTIVVLFASAFVKNMTMFVVLRMIDGFIMALPGGVMIQLLFTRFPSKFGRVIVYSFFYCVLLCSPAIINFLVGFTLDQWDWRYMIYGAIGVQIIGLAIIILLFNNKRLERKLPLYQVDFAGYIILVALLVAGTYVLVYGEKRYWLNAWDIRLGITIFIIFSGLFITRQKTSKRPLFNLDILKSANLRSGLLLFIILYIGRATLNVCHATMVQVWHWEQLYLAKIQWINAAGSATGVIIAATLLIRKFPVKYIFAASFGIMAIYLYWFRFLFKLEVGIGEIALPYYLQGLSVGLIFTPLIMFILAQAPSHLAIFGSRAGASTRFWATSLGFCLIHNAQVFLQRSHYISLSRNITATNPLAEERLSTLTATFISKGYSSGAAGQLAYKQLDASIRTQSFLLGNMEIFTWLAIVFIIFMILILLNKHLQQTYNLFRNKVFGY